MHKCPAKNCVTPPIDDGRILCAVHRRFVPDDLYERLMLAYAASLVLQPGHVAERDYARLLGEALAIVDAAVDAIQSRRYRTPKGHEKYGQRHDPGSATSAPLR